MKNLKELKEKLIVAGISDEILNLGKFPDGRACLHVNSADHIVVFEKDGFFRFATCGGSRYCHDFTSFSCEKQMDECAKYIFEAASLTNEEINAQYRRLWSFMTQ